MSPFQILADWQRPKILLFKLQSTFLHFLVLPSGRWISTHLTSNQTISLWPFQLHFSVSLTATFLANSSFTPTLLILSIEYFLFRSFFLSTCLLSFPNLFYKNSFLINFIWHLHYQTFFSMDSNLKRLSLVSFLMLAYVSRLVLCQGNTSVYLMTCHLARLCFWGNKLHSY